MKAQPHDREILRMAVPALAALVAEPLFLLVDSGIVAHLDTAAQAGLGVASGALSTLVSVCVFLAYGTTGAVARLVGAGQLRAALGQGFNGLWLAALIGVALTATAPFAPAIVHALGATADAAPYAITYLRLSAIGLPAMLVILAATGVLRGLQRMRVMVVVAIIGAIANAALNWALVFPAGLGIAGSALGTVLVQYAMAGVFVTVAVRAGRALGVPMWPDWAGIRAAGLGSTALLIRTVALRVYLLAGLAVAGGLGTAALGAYGLAMNIWNLLALALDALAIAAQGLVARYLGAADVPAARAVTVRVTAMGAAAGAMIGVLLYAARGVTAQILTPDHDVRLLLGSVLVLIAALQPIGGVVFALDGVLIGAGDGRYLAVAGIVSTALFLVAAGLVVRLDGGLTALWWAVAFHMLTRLVLLGARARGEAWMVTGARA
jgi:putative MATE family efflux protein